MNLVARGDDAAADRAFAELVRVNPARQATVPACRRDAAMVRARLWLRTVMRALLGFELQVQVVPIRAAAVPPARP